MDAKTYVNKGIKANNILKKILKTMKPSSSHKPSATTKLHKENTVLNLFPLLLGSACS